MKTFIGPLFLDQSEPLHQMSIIFPLVISVLRTRLSYFVDLLHIGCSKQNIWSISPEFLTAVEDVVVC